MPCLGKLSFLGYAVLLGALLFQWLLLVMTLSTDTRGLSWVSATANCEGSAELEYEFYREYLCIKSENTRQCALYVVRGTSDVFLTAKSDFGNAGNLAAAALAFTSILIIGVAAMTIAGDKLGVTKPTSTILTIVFIGMTAAMIIFCITAAALANSSEIHADTKNHPCSSTEVFGDYGVGVTAFLPAWMLAQIGIAVWPCGELAENSVEKPGLPSTNTARMSVEEAELKGGDEEL